MSETGREGALDAQRESRENEIKFQLLYNAAAGEHSVKEWTPWQIEHWEESGLRSSYGHDSQVGMYDSEEELARAIEELKGPDIFAVFEDKDSNNFYVTTENNLSGNWRGSKYGGDRLLGEYTSKEEAQAYIESQKKS